jgi:hypothetical protein
MPRRSASLFAISFVAGVICYSIRDIAHSSISGAVWFVGGFAAIFVPVYIYSALAANQIRIAKELIVSRSQAEEFEREGVSHGRTDIRRNSA